MGCLNTGRKGKENYTDSNFQEDSDLRHYEIEIGGQAFLFNSILQSLCLQKDHISIETVKNVILKDFNPLLIKAIQIDYFMKEVNGKKYYDEKKLRLFLFLFTQESLIVSKKEYLDKVNITNPGQLLVQSSQIIRPRRYE
jgi:hypothetical protein